MPQVCAVRTRRREKRRLTSLRFCAKEDAGTIDLSRKIFRTPTTGPPKEAEEPEEAEDPEGDAGYEGEGIVGDDVFD